MPDLSEDLSDEKPGAGESLDFTAEELLEELGRYWGIEERKEGDLDLQQILCRFHICRETARVKMKELVQAGKFEKLWVWDGGKRVKVYRKKG